MLQVLYETEGRTQVFNLSKEVAFIGRANDNDIVLNDFSVSRRHAFLKKEKSGWVIYDNQSTNGVRVNDQAVPQADVRDGDRALIGTFTLRFRDDPTASHRPGGRVIDSTSTRIRPIAELNQDFGLEKSAVPLSDSTAQRRRAALDVAYKNRVFEILVQVAKALISADDLSAVLDKVMDLIFEFLPADRGYLLLEEADGRLALSLSRFKSKKRPTSDGTTPYSRTIVDMVVKQKVAVLTSDAQTDERFESGDSIRLQQIRSAMCAPLWSGSAVIGVIYVDSPLHAGSFSEQDLDLLAALANFAAVAIERARLHDRVAEEKRIRGRLERYHSPQVIEEIITEAEATGDQAVKTKVVTILFADIVGFTRWSEKMPADELSRLLTEFFTLASDAVFACGGTIDKFIGDAVMAFFGAPLEQPDHAERAVAAALKIREGMAAWNTERGTRGDPPLEVRIAVNTGEAIVGDIGSERRVDYTVLGNAVNVAARLEEFVAQPGDIVVGPETWEAVRDRFEVAQLGFFALKGLSAQVPLYKVLSARDPGR
jgi:adenylate cyclase